MNLQDAFLNQCRKESIPVIVTLESGTQLKGLVTGFDNFTVILEHEGKQTMVYKHAIAVIEPSRPVNTTKETP